MHDVNVHQVASGYYQLSFRSECVMGFSFADKYSTRRMRLLAAPICKSMPAVLTLLNIQFSYGNGSISTSLSPTAIMPLPPIWFVSLLCPPHGVHYIYFRRRLNIILLRRVAVINIYEPYNLYNQCWPAASRQLIEHKISAKQMSISCCDNTPYDKRVLFSKVLRYEVRIQAPKETIVKHKYYRAQYKWIHEKCSHR